MTEIRIDKPNPKQLEFFKATARYIGYGGARGGGKSWAVRTKAFLLACRYAGIRILILRRSFPELRENHIRPLIALSRPVAQYKAADKTLEFVNGSIIIFGYCAGDSDLGQYQGQEYDVIFLDEATQFTEFQFKALGPCLRGTNGFPKRFYLTCNPGGVGHAWVKRLFIDREFREGERPEDYAFIQAKYTDNHAMQRTNPEYGAYLDALPPGLREAWRDGRWDVFAGQYFTEWDPERHIVKEPFTPPEWWRWYVAMDYGLDMLAAYLIAVDGEGTAWVVREVAEGKDRGPGHDGLAVSDAAERLKELAGDHRITAWLAPPDLWNRQSHTGKSTADLFEEAGIWLTEARNERVSGWLAVKEALKGRQDGRPRLRIFPKCEYLIRALPLLQYDEKNPSDAAQEPHDITHGPDALRYFCASRTMIGEPPAEDEEGPTARRDYRTYLVGDGPGRGILEFGR